MDEKRNETERKSGRTEQQKKRPVHAESGTAERQRKRPVHAESGRTEQKRKREGRAESGTAERQVRTENRAPVRKRNPEMMRLQRERELRRRLIIFGGCAALLVCVLIGAFALRRKGASSGGTERADAAAETAANQGQEAAAANAGDGTAQGTAEGTAAPAGNADPAGQQTAGQASAASAASPVKTADEPQLAYTSDEGDVYFTSDPAYSQKISILGTGDNIIHEALYQNAATEDGGYDFSPYYRLVRPYIEEADIATVNQEAPLASQLFDVSGYPHFNSPVQVADELAATGFDVLNLANNHILDQGESGLVASLDYLSENGIPYCGAYYDSDDMMTPRIIEKNGIRAAFVGFVNWTNVDPTDETQGQLIWNSDEEMVKTAIENAKSAADIVVVHVHWGEENEEPLTEEMTYLAQKMADWGADLILGNHTHVVQKMRILRRESDGKLVPVQFGGGNFLSGQKERAHLLSILTTADFAKNPDSGDVVCTGLHVRPIVTHYEGDRKNVCIYPLADYNDELAAQHGVKDFENETMTTEYLWDLIHEEIPEQFLVS